jgi:hypothetical protein
VGTLGLATALAFGLGGREMAAETIGRMRQKAMDAAPRMRQAADAARRQAAEQAEDARRLWEELGIHDRRHAVNDRRRARAAYQ